MSVQGSLTKYFGTSEEFWMNLQSNHEQRIERRVLCNQVDCIAPLQTHER